VLTAPGSESIRTSEEVFLIDRIEHRDHRSLDDFVFQCGDPQRALFAVFLRYEPPSDGQLRISANVTGDFGNVTDLELGAGLRG
jgi:hypothetical protein